MGTGDFIKLHASNDEFEDGVFNKENMDENKSEIRNLDEQKTQGKHSEVDLVQKLPTLQGNVGLVETVTTVGKVTGIESIESGGNNDMILGNEFFSSHTVDDVTGLKRSRMTYEDEQPSVHVTYNFLSRPSKRKLEELLHHWSEWHAQQCSLSKDSDEVLESGDETYFPALQIGLGPEKTSMVSFWMDNQVKEKHSKGFISLDDNAVPLYDREYTLGLTSMGDLDNLERGLETLNASRCFNCGSYNHTLKECPKPRDNVAIDNARKQHQSKRNRPFGPHVATRYYQDSPGGKYDGLKPGVLGPETRKLLNLGEFDPPPWLNRMREIGYPPGYLDAVDEDQSSGIKIYADEEATEDKENSKLNTSMPLKNMSVDFPGINSAIPEHADQRRWTTTQGPAGIDTPRNWMNHNRRGSWQYGVGSFPGYSPNMFESPRMRGDHPSGYSGCSPSYTSDPFSPRGYELGSFNRFDPDFVRDPFGPRGDELGSFNRFHPDFVRDPFSPRGDELGSFNRFHPDFVRDPFSPRSDLPWQRRVGWGSPMSRGGISPLFHEGPIHTADNFFPYTPSGSFRNEFPAYDGWQANDISHPDYRCRFW